VTGFGGISDTGIRPLYWIQFAVLDILLIFVSLTLKEVVRPKRILETISPWREFKEGFQRGMAIKRFLLFGSLKMYDVNMMFPFRYPYVNEVKGAGPLVIGGITTAMILAEAVFSTPQGRISDRIDKELGHNINSLLNL